MNNVIVGTSTFRLKLDEEFSNIEKLTHRVQYEICFNKNIAYSTIKNYFEQTVYVFLYRSILFFLISILFIIAAIISNQFMTLFSLLSLLFTVTSLIYFIKHTNLKNTLKIMINMTYSFYEIDNKV